MVTAFHGDGGGGGDTGTLTRHGDTAARPQKEPTPSPGEWRSWPSETVSQSPQLFVTTGRKLFAGDCKHRAKFVALLRRKSCCFCALLCYVFLCVPGEGSNRPRFL